MPTLCERIGALRAQLAEAAQGIVCDWDFEDGGACDVVAQDMAGVLGGAGIDSMDGGHDGDDHAWLIAYDPETREACGVDIPPGVYEVGGGYSWQGIEGTVVGPEDIALWPIPYADIEESIEDEYPEARLPNPAPDYEPMLWSPTDLSTPPQAVEVFSGGGLFALALDIEGVLAQHHCEMDPSAVATLQRSLDRDVTACDVTAYHPKPVPGGLDILSGGPPCQPWSQGGERKGQHDDRNLWPEIHRLIAEARPRIVLMENVPGILDRKHAPYLEWWWAEAAKLGYVGVIWELLAADYGSPQRRGRVWFVLWPEGAPWGPRLAQAPTATHADPRKIKPGAALLPWVRAFDRLNDGCCGGFGYTSCTFLGNTDRMCEGCHKGANYEQAPNDSDGADDELSDTAKQYLQAQTSMEKHPPADAAGFFAWKDLVEGQRRTTGVYLSPTVTKGLTKSREHFLFGTVEGSLPPAGGLACSVDEWMRVLRPLTVREVAKLQSVPQWYEFHAAPGLSEEARVHAMKAQVGNGIDVNMGRSVIRHALGALGYDVPRIGSLADDQERSSFDPSFQPQGLWPLYRIGACPAFYGSQPHPSSDPALTHEQIQRVLSPAVSQEPLIMPTPSLFLSKKAKALDLLVKFLGVAQSALAAGDDAAVKPVVAVMPRVWAMLASTSPDSLELPYPALPVATTPIDPELRGRMVKAIGVFIKFLSNAATAMHQGTDASNTILDNGFLTKLEAMLARLPKTAAHRPTPVQTEPRRYISWDGSGGYGFAVMSGGMPEANKGSLDAALAQYQKFGKGVAEGDVPLWNGAKGKFMFVRDLTGAEIAAGAQPATVLPMKDRRDQLVALLRSPHLRVNAQAGMTRNSITVGNGAGRIVAEFAMHGRDWLQLQDLYGAVTGSAGPKVGQDIRSSDLDTLAHWVAAILLELKDYADMNGVWMASTPQPARVFPPVQPAAQAPAVQPAVVPPPVTAAPQAVSAIAKVPHLTLVPNATETSPLLVSGYPMGRNKVSDARFWIQAKKNGREFRFVKQTFDNRSHKWNKPSASTYSHRSAIAQAPSGAVYNVTSYRGPDRISVALGSGRQVGSTTPSDPRHNELAAILGWSPQDVTNYVQRSAASSAAFDARVAATEAAQKAAEAAAAAGTWQPKDRVPSVEQVKAMRVKDTLYLDGHAANEVGTLSKSKRSEWWFSAGVRDGAFIRTSIGIGGGGKNSSRSIISPEEAVAIMAYYRATGDVPRGRAGTPVPPIPAPGQTAAPAPAGPAPYAASNYPGAPAWTLRTLVENVVDQLPAQQGRHTLPTPEGSEHAGIYWNQHAYYISHDPSGVGYLLQQGPDRHAPVWSTQVTSPLSTAYSSAIAQAIIAHEAASAPPTPAQKPWEHWGKTEAELRGEAVEAARKLGATDVMDFRQKRLAGKRGLPQDGSSGQYDAWTESLVQMLTPWPDLTAGPVPCADIDCGKPGCPDCDPAPVPTPTQPTKRHKKDPATWATPYWNDIDGELWATNGHTLITPDVPVPPQYANTFRGWQVAEPHMIPQVRAVVAAARRAVAENYPAHPGYFKKGYGRVLRYGDGPALADQLPLHGGTFATGMGGAALGPAAVQKGGKLVAIVMPVRHEPANGWVADIVDSSGKALVKTQFDIYAEMRAGMVGSVGGNLTAAGANPLRSDVLDVLWTPPGQPRQTFTIEPLHADGTTYVTDQRGDRLTDDSNDGEVLATQLRQAMHPHAVKNVPTQAQLPQEQADIEVALRAAMNHAGMPKAELRVDGISIVGTGPVPQVYLADARGLTGVQIAGKLDWNDVPDGAALQPQLQPQPQPPSMPDSVLRGAPLQPTAAIPVSRPGDAPSVAFIKHAMSGLPDFIRFETKALEDDHPATDTMLLRYAYTGPSVTPAGYKLSANDIVGQLEGLRRVLAGFGIPIDMTAAGSTDKDPQAEPVAATPFPAGRGKLGYAVLDIYTEDAGAWKAMQPAPRYAAKWHSHIGHHLKELTQDVIGAMGPGDRISVEWDEAGGMATDTSAARVLVRRTAQGWHVQGERHFGMSHKPPVKWNYDYTQALDAMQKIMLFAGTGKLEAPAQEAVEVTPWEYAAPGSPLIGRLVNHVMPVAALTPAVILGMSRPIRIRWFGGGVDPRNQWDWDQGEGDREKGAVLVTKNAQGWWARGQVFKGGTSKQVNAVYAFGSEAVPALSSFAETGDLPASVAPATVPQVAMPPAPAPTPTAPTIFGHYAKGPEGRPYGDSGLLSHTAKMPGATQHHMGMGEFYYTFSDGSRIDFHRRSNADEFPGFSGRSHLITASTPERLDAFKVWVEQNPNLQLVHWTGAPVPPEPGERQRAEMAQAAVQAEIARVSAEKAKIEGKAAQTALHIAKSIAPSLGATVPNPMPRNVGPFGAAEVVLGSTQYAIRFNPLTNMVELYDESNTDTENHLGDIELAGTDARNLIIDLVKSWHRLNYGDPAPVAPDPAPASAGPRYAVRYHAPQGGDYGGPDATNIARDVLRRAFPGALADLGPDGKPMADGETWNRDGEYVAWAVFPKGDPGHRDLPTDASVWAAGADVDPGLTLTVFKVPEDKSGFPGAMESRDAVVYSTHERVNPTRTSIATRKAGGFAPGSQRPSPAPAPALTRASLLKYLHDSGDEVALHVLAASFPMSSAAISALLTSMEAEGSLVSRPGPHGKLYKLAAPAPAPAADPTALRGNTPDTIRQVLQSLRAGDVIFIGWKEGSSSKSGTFTVKTDYADASKRAYLVANRQSRSGGGEIRDHGPKYGVQFQQTPAEQTKAVTALQITRRPDAGSAAPVPVFRPNHGDRVVFQGKDNDPIVVNYRGELDGRAVVVMPNGIQISVEPALLSPAPEPPEEPAPAPAAVPSIKDQFKAAWDMLGPGETFWLEVDSLGFGDKKGWRQFVVGRTTYSAKHDVHSKRLYPVKDGQPVKTGMKWVLFKRGADDISLAAGDMYANVRGFSWSSPVSTAKYTGHVTPARPRTSAIAADLAAIEGRGRPALPINVVMGESALARFTDAPSGLSIAPTLHDAPQDRRRSFFVLGGDATLGTVYQTREDGPWHVGTVPVHAGKRGATSKVVKGREFPEDHLEDAVRWVWNAASLTPGEDRANWGGDPEAALVPAPDAPALVLPDWMPEDALVKPAAPVAKDQWVEDYFASPEGAQGAPRGSMGTPLEGQEGYVPAPAVDVGVELGVVSGAAGGQKPPTAIRAGRAPSRLSVGQTIQFGNQGMFRWKVAEDLSSTLGPSAKIKEHYRITLGNQSNTLSWNPSEGAWTVFSTNSGRRTVEEPQVVGSASTATELDI